MESEIQNRQIQVENRSLKLKAVVATLKCHLIENGQAIFVENNESTLRVISKAIKLALKENLSDTEKLDLYMDYYFNDAARKAYIDTDLENCLILKYGILETNDSKGDIFCKVLSYLAKGLDQAADHAQNMAYWSFVWV